MLHVTMTEQLSKDLELSKVRRLAYQNLGKLPRHVFGYEPQLQLGHILAIVPLECGCKST